MFGRKKQPARQWEEIARIEEYHKDGGLFAGFMLGVGALLMLAILVFDNSAVRIAAYGAVWTGWNVLWGLVILVTRRCYYIVIREIPEKTVGME